MPNGTSYSHPNIVVLSGYSSQRLGASVAHHMNVEEGKIAYSIFNNEEIKPVLERHVNLRNADVVIIAGAAGTPNNIIFETQLLQDIAIDGQCRSVTTVVPSLPYGRQDSSFGERAPVGLVRAVRNLFNNSNYGIVVDPHNANGTAIAARGIHGLKYQPIHYAPLFALQIANLIQKDILRADNTSVFGLDKGGAERMSAEFIEAIRSVTGIDMPASGKDLPYLNKWRDRVTGKSSYDGTMSNATEEDIAGKDIVAFEDMVDTGGSAVDAADLFKHKGARSVTLFTSNGIFSVKRVDSSGEIISVLGKKYYVKRSDKAPDQTLSIVNIDNRASGGKGLDAVFVSNNYDFALTDPRVAKAIADSHVIHEIDVAPFLAEIILAVHNQDRSSNSVSRRLAADAQFIERLQGHATPLKPDSPLHGLAHRSEQHRLTL